MNKKPLYRQGDVLVMKVDNIADKLKKTKKCTLALGEATGHHHTIHEGAVGFADQEQDLAKYFNVSSKNGASLTHQEHDTIVLPEGSYKVIGQFQYTPERLTRAAD